MLRTKFGWLLLATALIVLAVVACSKSAQPTSTPTPKPTDTPAPTATGTPRPTAVPTSTSPAPTVYPTTSPTGAPTPTAVSAATATPTPTATRVPTTFTPTPSPTPTTKPTPTQPATPTFTPTPAAGQTLTLDPTRMSAMDAYALSAPQSAVASLSTLSTYFAASSNKDIEKARAIFRWIAENISYDVQGFLTKNYGDQSPDAVLKRRSAVCEGYARLFETLGKAAGLKVMVISGWAKGFSFNLGDLSGDTNHAWNAISIDGAWYIVESTWGAGSINESKQFAKKFDDYYFLPAPEQLIYTHFPKDQQWQLLAKSLSKTEFAELPEANRGFFKYGLQFVSHRTASIAATKELAVTLSAPSDIALTANLEWQGPDIPDTYTFAQKEDSYYVVRAIFPEAASYRLVIYAKKQSDPGMYEGVLKYQVSASEAAGDKAGYPIVYGTFSEKAARLYTPMTYYLRSGLYHSFRIAVPGAEKVAVVMGQSFYHLTGQGGVWTADVMAKQGAIEVCAQYPGNVSYNCLLRYEGW